MHRTRNRQKRFGALARVSMLVAGLPAVAAAMLLAGCANGRVSPPGMEDGGAGYVYTIKQVRDRSLKQRPQGGSSVLIHGAVITAIRGSASPGVYVREGTGPHQAIFVYFGGAQPLDHKGIALRRGDLVSVQGELHTFKGTDEIVKPTVYVSGNGDAAPVSVKTTSLAPGSSVAEGWESHLVRIAGVSVAGLTTNSDSFWVTDSSGSCGAKQSGCTLVSDFFFDGGAKNGAPAAKVGWTFSSISGVVNGHTDQHTLDPRTASDLVWK